MIDTTRRRIISQFVIAAMLCGGLYIFLAAPLRERKLDVKAELENAAAMVEQAEILQTMHPVFQNQEAKAVARADAIAQRSAPGVDETVLFAEIMGMADECGIRVERLSPAGRDAPSIRQTAHDPDAQTVLAPRPGDTVSIYTISGSGGYSDTATFLDRLTSPWAYCAITNARITPDTNGEYSDSVMFTCTLQLHAFDASPVMPETTDEVMESEY